MEKPTRHFLLAVGFKLFFYLFSSSPAGQKGGNRQKYAYADKQQYPDRVLANP